MDGCCAFMNAAFSTRVIRGAQGGVVVCLSLALTALATDWPQYRGPTHDGSSTDRINKQWTGAITNAVWFTYLTNGLTSLTVGGGRVFTQVAQDSD